jgi:hypothetical protein
VRLQRIDHIAIKAGASFGGCYKFKLKNFIGGASYDYYRIKKVVVQFRPRITPSIPDSEIKSTMCFGYIDLDDCTVSTDYRDYIQKQNVRQWATSKFMAFKWTPKVHYYVDAKPDTGATVPTAAAFRPGRQTDWLNTYFDGIDHYGLKYYLAVGKNPESGANADAQMEWDIVQKIYVQFKQPFWNKPTNLGAKMMCGKQGTTDNWGASTIGCTTYTENTTQS